MVFGVKFAILAATIDSSFGANPESRVGATGAVVRDKSGELALRMPMNPLSVSDQTPPLLDVSVASDVAMPEIGADALVTLSLDDKQRLHIHRTSNEHKDSTWTRIAWADYKNTVSKNGWGYLSVKATADPHVSNELKMYGAGFLEGFTTGKQIKQFQHNANALIAKDESQHSAMGNIRDLFSREVRTVCTHSGVHTNGTILSSANSPSDLWWRHARLMLLQGFGIMDAYNLHASSLSGTPMSFVDLLVLNSDGETPELEMAYDFNEVALREAQADCSEAGDCGDEDASFVQEKRSVKRSRRMRGALEPNEENSRKVLSNAKSRRARAFQKLKAAPDAEWRKIKAATGRCSALVRLAANNSDVFIGHTTFSDYSEMNRIWKYYDFPLGAGASQRMGFSSYPGVMGSTDDYYIMDTGLVVTETTVSMLSDSPFDKLNESSVAIPDYMRIMLSNKLAKTGKEWVNYMENSATGTYNSQWMVLDYNLFAPGKQLQNGTLWVLEQAPGVSVAVDESSQLQHQGFWASENRAAFSQIRNISGETEAAESVGALFSADHNPRANIFSKTAPAVNLLDDMRHEMQRNKWPHEVDGGEHNTPDHAIAARGDLAKGSAASPNGGVDSKVTNFCLAQKLSADAIAGPTHDGQIPFKWTDTKGKELYPDYPHDGLPDVWNFDWVRMTPDGEASITSQCAHPN